MHPTPLKAPRSARTRANTKVAETIFKAFTRVPDGAVRRRKSQKLGENSGSETRQAMAVITLARSCPYTSMALVLSINKIGGNGFDRSR
jgi:hypothetical protein